MESTTMCESPARRDSMTREIPEQLTNLPQYFAGSLQMAGHDAACGSTGCAKPWVVALTVPMRPIPAF
jgi:hypothetical protein